MASCSPTSAACPASASASAASTSGRASATSPRFPELVEGACDAIRANKATYSKFEGIDILRERIARKVERHNGFTADPAKEIVVTVGSSGGFLAAAMATLNVGDEVILFEPYYGYHLNTLQGPRLRDRNSSR